MSLVQRQSVASALQTIVHVRMTPSKPDLHIVFAKNFLLNIADLILVTFIFE